MQEIAGKLWLTFLAIHGPTRGIIPSGYDVNDVFLYVGLVLLGATAISILRPFAWGAKILKVILPLIVISLAVIALVPMVTAPLGITAEVERIFLAALKPLHDWNHPSLQYLILHPVFSLSMEPWVIKLVPATWVVLASLLIFIEGRQLGGSLGGLLAASWYAAGCRVRMGIQDLGDWDLAVVLLLLVFRLFRKLDAGSRTFGTKTIVYLGLLFLLASMSSFLAIIPLGLAVLLLTYKAFIDPAYKPLAVVSTLVVAIRAAYALYAFNVSFGGTSIPNTLGKLLLAMGRQLQPGSNVGAFILVAFGFAVILVSKRTLPMAFLLGSIILVPIGITVIWKFSVVNGGYYINLMSGFIALVGAFAVGQIFGLDPTFQYGLQNDQESSPSIKSNPRIILPFMVGAVLLVFLTVKLPAPNIFGNQSNSSTFERLIANDQLPVVTNMEGMIEAVNYYRTIRTDKNLKRVEALHYAIIAKSDGGEVFDGVRTWILCLHGSQGDKCLPKDQDYYLALRDPIRPISGGLNRAIYRIPQTCKLALPSPDKAAFFKCQPTQSVVQ